MEWNANFVEMCGIILVRFVYYVKYLALHETMRFCKYFSGNMYMSFPVRLTLGVWRYGCTSTRIRRIIVATCQLIWTSVLLLLLGIVVVIVHFRFSG